MRAQTKAMPEVGLYLVETYSGDARSLGGGPRHIRLSHHAARRTGTLIVVHTSSSPLGGATFLLGGRPYWGLLVLPAQGQGARTRLVDRALRWARHELHHHRPARGHPPRSRRRVLLETDELKTQVSEAAPPSDPSARSPRSSVPPTGLPSGPHAVEALPLQGAAMKRGLPVAVLVGGTVWGSVIAAK